MAADIADLRKKLADVEADQNSLCDSERFEEAGALDSTIQELKESIMRRLEDVAAASRQMETLSRDLLSVAEKRASLADKAFDRVQALQQESHDALAEARERDERRLRSEAAHLDSERRRLDLARSHLEKDSANLAEEWQQVTNTISQQTLEHVQEREEKTKLREKIDEEIAEMQRRLSEKTAERWELSEDLEECERCIESIRAKFEKQLTRLECKKKRQEEAENEAEQDATQVAEMADELQRDREACHTRLEEGQKQISEIRYESRKLKGIRRFMLRSVRMRTVWQRLMEPHQDALNQARQRWEGASREFQDLSTTSEGREAEAAKLRSQIDAVRLQLPSLEAEKKKAVASRSFKEAGRITEDIKRREEELRTYEAELESLQGELAATRDALAAARQFEEETQASLLQEEERCAKEEVRILQRQALDLEALCEGLKAGSQERLLFEEECRVLQRSMQHLVKEYSIDVETLESIPPEDPKDRDGEGDSAASTEDEGAIASEDGNATSSGREREREPVGVPAEASADESSLVKTPGVGAAVGTSAQSTSPPTAHEQIDLRRQTPEAMRQRRAGLADSIEKSEAEQVALEAEIEACCEQEDFDRAQALEEKRSALEQELKVARAEAQSLDDELAMLPAEEEDLAEDRGQGVDGDALNGLPHVVLDEVEVEVTKQERTDREEEAGMADEADTTECAKAMEAPEIPNAVEAASPPLSAEYPPPPPSLPAPPLVPDTAEVNRASKEQTEAAEDWECAQVVEAAGSENVVGVTPASEMAEASMTETPTPAPTPVPAPGVA